MHLKEVITQTLLQKTVQRSGSGSMSVILYWSPTAHSALRATLMGTKLENGESVTRHCELCFPILLCFVFLYYTDMAKAWTCIAWTRPWIANCFNQEDTPDPTQVLVPYLLPPQEKAVLPSTIRQWLFLHFLAGNMEKNVHGKCVCVMVYLFF